VYNGDDYVGEAIASILAQTYPDFELLIQDNASTDRTEAICGEYARRDPRVSYVRNPQNVGAIPNFNLVFERARGMKATKTRVPRGRRSAKDAIFCACRGVVSIENCWARLMIATLGSRMIVSADARLTAQPAIVRSPEPLPHGRSQAR
jgi:glycosyltransferase involved in cell wall biosynthesis